jgi:DNA-binding GntR family transcriptional regulator
MADKGNRNRLNLKLDIPDPKLLENRIADLLRNGIVTGKIPLGGKLNEEELSSTLNVSRTPIRQALHILEIEGLVELIPRRGAFVSRITQKDAEELYQILGMIEGFAAVQLIVNEKTNLSSLDEINSYMAIQIEKANLKLVIQANLDFHYTLVKMVENQRLVTIYQNARNPTRVFQSMGLSSKTDWAHSLLDHRQIVTAICQCDAEAASRLCLEHNMNKCRQVISSLFQTSIKLD